MTIVPNTSPRDESTDHIPDTGSDTPRDTPTWPTPLGRHPALAKTDENLRLELVALKAERPWITEVVVVRLMDELNADLAGDETRVPRLFTHIQTVATTHYAGLTAELVDIGGRELSAVVVHATQEAAELVAFDDHAELSDFLDLYDFDHAGLTAELREEWSTTTTRDPSFSLWLNKQRYRNTGLTFERSEADHYFHQEWSLNARIRAELRADLDKANDYIAELRGVIQRQGGRVDREHAGLVAQVTRLTTELDNANLHNAELRAIVAGRSNQVEDELDEALRVGANYRTKVAALFTELGEAIDLLEAVSAETDSYADRLKTRGAA